MSAGLDEWDSIKQLSIPLEITTTTKDLIQAFSFHGPQFTNQTLWDFSIGTEIATAQDHSLATFTTKIEKEDGLVDIYTTPIEQILRKYNAYYLRPKIYFIHNNKRVIIEQISIIYKNMKKYIQYKIEDPSFSYSLIDQRNNKAPTIKELLIKPEGKKTMTREEFKSGYVK